jgi:hypothetical protein
MKRPKIFKDRELLKEMLTLRRQGFTYKQLADKYKVDYTSIKHWCDIYGLGGHVIQLVRQFYKDNGIELARKPRILVVDVSQMWVNEEGDRMCQGKSYQEYLEDEVRRTNPTRKKLNINL